MESRLLPCPQVALDLLDLYKNDRSNLHNTYFEKAKYYSEKAMGVVTGELSVEEQLANIVNLVTERINAAKTLDDWIKLILFLGKQAEAAQFSKTFKEEQSLLCFILHMIRDYIVSQLKKTPQGSDALQKRITKLLTDANLTQKNINECAKPKSDQIVTDKHGRAWEGLNTDLNEILLELAYLGDELSISKARQFHLLDYMIKLTEEYVEKMKGVNLAENYNFSFPFGLQPDFCPFYYQHYTGKTFDKFEQAAIVKYDKSLKGVKKEADVEVTILGPATKQAIPPTMPPKPSQGGAFSAKGELGQANKASITNNKTPAQQISTSPSPT